LAEIFFVALGQFPVIIKSYFIPLAITVILASGIGLALIAEIPRLAR
jgi:hypothetical protein